MDKFLRMLLDDFQDSLAPWQVGISPGLEIRPVADPSYLVHQGTQLRIGFPVDQAR